MKKHIIGWVLCLLASAGISYGINQYLCGDNHNRLETVKSNMADELSHCQKYLILKGQS